MTEIYGQEIDIWPAQDGDVVTDVIVLARVIRFSDDGTPYDALIISNTSHTTAMVQMGMVGYLNETIRQEGQ